MKMNKILAVLLSVAMLCVMIPAFTVSAGVGTVENGDFESNNTANWTVKGCSTTSDQKRGSYSLKMPINSDNYGSIAAQQVVPVNRNAVYTLKFYFRHSSGSGTYQYEVVAGTDKDNLNVTLVSKTNVTSSRYSWSSTEKKGISVGSNTYIAIRFWAPSSGNNRTHYLDDVTLTATTVGDTTTHADAVPTMESVGTQYNVPKSESNNLVVQPGFESTTNAQWNTSDFLKQGVSIVTDDAAGAHSGSAYLKYYHGSVNYTEWPAFEVTLPSAGTYVFSAWVRTPGLSADNQGKASIGVMNPKTGKFLTYGSSGGSYDGHYSNQEVQLRSTATDNDWHLRSVTFSVVSAAKIKIGMYGLKSTMYVDDISIHLESNGTEYKGDQHGTLSASKSSTNYYCASEANLIPDANINSSLAVDFWSGASGWNNGFLEIAKDAQNTDRGNTLHFKGTNPASNKKYRYVKFVYVEPNTKYYVSFDYRVVKSGSQLMFIDNNIRKNATFHTPTLSGNSWGTYTFSFNTGNYNRIGIVFQDGTGEAYYDDFRFFKDGDKTTTEPEEEIFPTLEPEHTGKSRMEMGINSAGKMELGLAFRFELPTTGVKVGVDYVADYAGGKVDAFEDGGEYKLVCAGAVMTNDASVGQNETAFVRDNRGNTVGGKQTVVDVDARYISKSFVDGSKELVDSLIYAVRITNIPENHKGTVIYARPYYVFEYEGKEITVYGDIVYDCYEKIPDINDGWLEWD